MAKKRGGINRSAKVKEYLVEHPGESINEVLEGLAVRGTKVSRSLISQVKKTLGQTGARGAGGRKRTAKKKASGAGATQTAAKAPSATARGVITAEDLYEAKKLADDLGGIERVRKALDALERLQ